MDDPAWSWPAWKFGLKRDDLATTLHEQYNTVSFSIQDPEAFHHDVYEVSREAGTTEEFHHLMKERRQQRLHELNDSLETLAVEIIANPLLMASDQWQYALQLFRSKSYDSIVRFFASYVPDVHVEKVSKSYSKSSSASESALSSTTTASSTDDAHSTSSKWLSDEDAFTVEPGYLSSKMDERIVDGPLSPPESNSCLTEDDEDVNLPSDTESHESASTNPPSRSMSFSGSESVFGCGLLRRSFTLDDDVSQSDDCDTAATSVSDSAEARSMLDATEDKDYLLAIEHEHEEELPPAQYPEDDWDDLHTPILNDTPGSETPTPRSEPATNSYIDYKSVLAKRLPSPCRRSLSPKPHASSYTRGEQTHRNPIRRSPEEGNTKVQKPAVADVSKRRLKGKA